MRMLEEEAQHLARGVGTARVGEGAAGTAARPGVPGAVDDPLLEDDLAIGRRMERAAPGAAAGRAPLLHRYFERRRRRRLRDHRVAVGRVDGGVAIAVEDDRRNAA